MILKIIGSIFIIGASSVLGFYYAGKETFRINDLSEMKRAMLILISEIEYSMNTLPEAVKNISSKINKPVSYFFDYFYNRLSERGINSIDEIWSESIDTNKNKTYFDSEDIECFKSFGSTLGYLDKNMQINNINMVIEYIDYKIEFINNSVQKNKKMYQSLGLLGGMLITIILL